MGHDGTFYSRTFYYVYFGSRAFAWQLLLLLYCITILTIATKILLTTSILFFWLPTKFFGMDWFPILFIIANASKKLLKFQKLWVTNLRTCRPIILCWIIFITYVITTWINLCMSYLFFNFLKLLLSNFLIIFSYYIISVFNVAQNLLHMYV